MKRSISEQLLHAIETCGMSRYELSRQSGVTQAALSRFVNGRRSLTLTAVDRICAVLKLELVKKGR